MIRAYPRHAGIRPGRATAASNARNVLDHPPA